MYVNSDKSQHKCYVIPRKGVKAGHSACQAPYYVLYPTQAIKTRLTKGTHVDPASMARVITCNIHLHAISNQWSTETGLTAPELHVKLKAENKAL